MGDAIIDDDEEIPLGSERLSGGGAHLFSDFGPYSRAEFVGAAGDSYSWSGDYSGGTAALFDETNLDLAEGIRGALSDVAARSMPAAAGAVISGVAGSADYLSGRVSVPFVLISTQN